MWTEVPGYRMQSPGQTLVPTFLERALWKSGDTLVDLGCGPGRAGLELSKAGLNVTLLDITKKAVDSEHFGALPFIEACLWEIDGPSSWDWLFCCDVLEHIPPEHVDKVLDNMQVMTAKGAFMNIALWQEHWGSKIGETLHLSIESPHWWAGKVEQRWPIIWREISRDDRLLILTGPPK